MFPQQSLDLKAAGDQARLAFVGQDGAVRFLILAPAAGGARAAVVSQRSARSLPAKGTVLKNVYELEASVPFTELGLDPNAGKPVPFDVAILDADSRAEDVDSEFVWAGADHEPAEPAGFGSLTFAR